MTPATPSTPQPSAVGPTTPPGPQTSQPKPPSTFPEQTAQLVDVLKSSNSSLIESLDRERARLATCNQELARLLDEKAGLQEKNAKLQGENTRLTDHLNEVRELRNADRARHAIVAIIASAVIAAAGGMIDTTTGDVQKRWLIVLLAGTAFLAVYSLLVYSDDIRQGLVKYGVIGGIGKVLFGKIF